MFALEILKIARSSALRFSMKFLITGIDDAKNLGRLRPLSSSSFSFDFSLRFVDGCFDVDEGTAESVVFVVYASEAFA